MIGLYIDCPVGWIEFDNLERQWTQARARRDRLAARRRREVAAGGWRSSRWTR